MLVGAKCVARSLIDTRTSSPRPAMRETDGRRPASSSSHRLGRHQGRGGRHGPCLDHGTEVAQYPPERRQPGAIPTEGYETVQGMTPEQVRDFAAKCALEIPVGRVGRAEEIGDAVVFLASSASSFVDGINLVVDGGKPWCRRVGCNSVCDFMLAARDRTAVSICELLNPPKPRTRPGRLWPSEYMGDTARTATPASIARAANWTSSMLRASHSTRCMPWSLGCSHPRSLGIHQLSISTNWSRCPAYTLRMRRICRSRWPSVMKAARTCCRRLACACPSTVAYRRKRTPMQRMHLGTTHY